MYYGVDPSFPPTLLPVGVPSQDFNVDIHVKVSDTLGASVEVSMVVKVENSRFIFVYFINFNNMSLALIQRKYDFLVMIQIKRICDA